MTTLETFSQRWKETGVTSEDRGSPGTACLWFLSLTPRKQKMRGPGSLEEKRERIGEDDIPADRQLKTVMGVNQWVLLPGLLLVPEDPQPPLHGELAGARLDLSGRLQRHHEPLLSTRPTRNPGSLKRRILAPAKQKRICLRRRRRKRHIIQTKKGNLAGGPRR